MSAANEYQAISKRLLVIERQQQRIEALLSRLVDYTPPTGGVTDTTELARQILSGNSEYLRQHNKRFRESQRQQQQQRRRKKT